MKNIIWKIPVWILIVLCLSMVITLWDALFVLLRPESLPGGSLAFIWKPYAKYITIDTAYQNMHEPFVVAQAIMTLFEISIGCFALYFYFTKRHSLATLLAFSSLLLTGAKTILIFVEEAASNFVHVAQNSLHDLILLYVIPNGIWVVVPLVCVVVLAHQLLNKIVPPIP